MINQISNIKYQNDKSKFKNILHILICACLIFGDGFWISYVYSENHAQALNLQELITEAKKNNPEILAAKKRWEAASARIPQVKSLDNPTVGITVEKIPRGTFQLNNIMPNDDRMLSVTQMFPFLGKLSLKGKIALVESQMFASEYKDKELEVTQDVKNSYYDLFIHHKKVELNKESLIYLEAASKIAESKYLTGEVSQEELFKINLEIAKLVNDIENHKIETEAHETHLNSLLNREPEGSLGMPVLEEEISFNKGIKEVYKLTLENQPELLIFSYAIEKNKFAKALAKRSLLPDMMAGIVQRGIGSGSIGPWDLMLSLSVPFWFWTKQRYEIKEAVINLEEAQAAYQAMKNRAFSEVKNVYSEVKIAESKIKLYKNNLLPLLESSLNISLFSFRSGKGDIMGFLDTQRMLIETKMSYYESLVEYNISLAELERMVGVELLTTNNTN